MHSKWSFNLNETLILRRKLEYIGCTGFGLHKNDLFCLLTWTALVLKSKHSSTTDNLLSSCSSRLSLLFLLLSDIFGVIITMLKLFIGYLYKHLLLKSRVIAVIIIKSTSLISPLPLTPSPSFSLATEAISQSSNFRMCCVPQLNTDLKLIMFTTFLFFCETTISKIMFVVHCDEIFLCAADWK